MLPKTYLLLMLTLAISCKEQKKEDRVIEEPRIENQTQITSFDWLLGLWKRMNEKSGIETFEIWKKNNPTEYSGIGFTLQNRDTVKQERILLKKTKDKWYLIVEIPEESARVLFTVKEIKNNEFTCVNNKNDFPKTIKYWIHDERLFAKVSNEEMEIPFEFEKVDK